ncbi:MAG TPA: four-carbon acid sugar kinase family protein [Rubrobacter sp.]|nr:four-carbon acid sugar kinase family protein [Rubrobacter sp.]
MASSDGLLLTFYGDDFTGSTDAMESLAQAGIRTILFLKPPTPEVLAGITDVGAIGLAGDSRAMTPEDMEQTLPGAFSQLKDLGAPLFHYKVCSTFDSSPEIGSIGCATDLGQQIFASPFVPLLVGALELGRYTVFGNHFARSGVDGKTYRLDQHAPMRDHPVTPMRESDLRLHLSQQTAKTIELFDILQLEGHKVDTEERLKAVLESGPEIVLFDVLFEDQLSTLGGLIWNQASRETPLFVVGSSGVESALTALWRATGELAEPQEFEGAGEVEQLVAVSGSCSPVTDGQIERAIRHGFVDVPLDPAWLVDPEGVEKESEAAVEKMLDEISKGNSVIAHTCRGPQDPRREATGKRLEALGYKGLAAKLKGGRILAETTGSILQAVLERADVQRVAVAGGDTSSYIASQLDIRAVEMVAPAAPGAPLCRVYSEEGTLEGMEIVFKGGQMGGQDFFESVRRGTTKDIVGGGR